MQLIMLTKLHFCALVALQTTLEFLRGICSDVKVVQGDFDDFESPEQLVRHFVAACASYRPLSGYKHGR